MTVYDDVITALREFKRYTGDGLPNEPVGAPLPVGDPASGVWNPRKSDLRGAFGGLAQELLNGIAYIDGMIPAIEAARDEALAEIDASKTEFYARYLGAHANDPTTDNEGNPLIDGALYWNTTTKVFRAYDAATGTWNSTRYSFAGPWNDTDTFSADSLVEYGGSIWLARRSNTNVTPAEGADWTLFLPGVTVADGSVTFAKLADTAYDWPKAFGAAEVNDAATNDAAFAALEASAVAGRAVDLGGKVYRVSTVPTGACYEHGYWEIENYDETATVRIPAKNTINRTIAQLTNDDSLDGQPQDSWHSYNDGVGKWPVVFALWRQRSNNLHGGGEEYQSMLCRSKDGGLTWGEVEWIIPSEYNRQPFAAGQVDGQQFVIVRDTQQPHKLFGRRLYQRRELTGQSVSWDDDELIIENMPDHGVKVGDTVRILDWSGSAIQTITPDGEYTVVRSEDDRFGITVPGLTFSTGDIVSRSFNLEFVEGPFTEILFGGEHLGDALTTADPTNFPNPTTLFMHFEPNGSGNGGSFYTATHGGGGNAAGPWMVRIDDALQSATIGAVKQISTYGVEASIRKDADGYLYTMIRAQEDGEAVQFGWSDDEGDTWTLTTGPAYPWALLSGTAMVIVGDKLFASLSGARNATALLTEEGIVPMYLLEATLVDLRADGFDAFTITKIQDMYFADGRTGEGSVTGVQSMLAVRDRLIIGYCSEFAPTKDNLGGLSDVFSLTIELDGDSIEKAQGREIIPYTFVREPTSYRTIRLFAFVNADGTIASRTSDSGLQLAVTKAGTGQYDFTFLDVSGGGPYNIATTSYYVQATCGTGGRIANWNAKGSTSFRIETTANGGALTDTRFLVNVDILR